MCTRTYTHTNVHTHTMLFPGNTAIVKGQTAKAKSFRDYIQHYIQDMKEKLVFLRSYFPRTGLCVVF